MSCSFFGVGVGEQLFAISTEFTKGLHEDEMSKNWGRLKKELPVYRLWVILDATFSQRHLIRQYDGFFLVFPL